MALVYLVLEVGGGVVRRLHNIVHVVDAFEGFIYSVPCCTSPTRNDPDYGRATEGDCEPSPHALPY